MIKRKLGRSGLQVSKVALSCMGLGLSGTSSIGSRREAIASIRAAHDLGITFFDTAATHGPFIGEEVVGEAIAPFRNDVVVSTKFGYRIEDRRVVAVDSRPQAIRGAVEGSLRRLGVEAIDVLYLQRVDPSVPVEDVAGAVGELVQQGLVKHFGLCEADLPTLQRAHAVHPVSVQQADYSLWTRNTHEGLLEGLESMGIGLVPWNPLGQGYMSMPGASAQAGLAANRELLARIRRVADSRGATVMQVATAWLMATRPWIVPMIDAADLVKMSDGLIAADLALDEKDMAALRYAGDFSERTLHDGGKQDGGDCRGWHRWLGHGAGSGAARLAGERIREQARSA